jgi:hypothetical protein
LLPPDAIPHGLRAALGSAETYRTLVEGLNAQPATRGHGDAAPAQFSGLNDVFAMGLLGLALARRPRAA